MTLRRYKAPNTDLWKTATKKIKVKTMDETRKIQRDDLGQRFGKAYIQQQDLGTLALKKIKRRKLDEEDEVEVVDDLEAQIKKISNKQANNIEADAESDMSN